MIKTKNLKLFEQALEIFNIIEANRFSHIITVGHEFLKKLKL